MGGRPARMPAVFIGPGKPMNALKRNDYTGAPGVGSTGSFDTSQKHT
jgi:hypothetical protein